MRKGKDGTIEGMEGVLTQIIGGYVEENNIGHPITLKEFIEKMPEELRGKEVRTMGDLIHKQYVLAAKPPLMDISAIGRRNKQYCKGWNEALMAYSRNINSLPTFETPVIECKGNELIVRGITDNYLDNEMECVVVHAETKCKEFVKPDRPTGKFDEYTEWLEEKLLECEPSILCSVVSNEQDEWCEKNCENMRPECLRKCYKICKGEIL